MSGWDAFGHLTDLEKAAAAKLLRVDPATVIGPVIGLIVGEMPGRSSNPRMPMFPYPPNSAGGRLQKMSRLTMGEFLGRIRRVNLIEEFDEFWDPILARQNAIKITQSLRPGTRVVLCGRLVGEAFDVHDYFKNYEHGGSIACAIPHPSGLNRLYSQPSVRAAAGLAIEWAADLRKTS